MVSYIDRNTWQGSVLSRVEEGMSVLDSNGHRVGKVKGVQFGDENVNEPGVNTVTPSQNEEGNDFVEVIADALVGDDNLPEALRARMMRYGYVRIDTGLLSADCFATADQITGIVDGDLHLNVTGDELIRL
ncbi:MAG: hypothetical protein SF029_19595 [bacterium]|nr:hypothetical protein [bacterium]